MTEEPWAEPPAALALTAHDVHLWRIRLPPAHPLTAEPSSVLSPEERSRRDRFVSDRDRKRYGGTRAFLRFVLAKYLRVPPGQVRIEEDSNGKPRAPGSSIEFNVSHSGELALAAIASGRRVGVDVEQVRLIAEADSIARRFFSGPEYRLLGETSEDRRGLAFLQCWTSKEAQVKALGGGLRIPLDQIDVWRAAPRRHYEFSDGPARGSWTLQQLSADGDFPAALVVEGDDDWVLRLFAAAQ